MNEQFCKLPEEKQQRIINAALRVFSQNDYKHASTEQIAYEAGISKGLLFYYFHNKQSLYLFVFDYVNEQIGAQVCDPHFSEITDFFALLAYAAQKKAEIIRRFPDLMDFCVRAFSEGEQENVPGLRERFKRVSADSFAMYFQNIDFSKFRDDVDPRQIYRFCIWMAFGYLQEKKLTRQPISVSTIMEDFHAWSEMLKKVAYKEEYLCM